MKAAEKIITSAAQIQRKSATSFFGHAPEQETPFFAGKEAAGADSFFSPSVPLSKNPTIQAKLTVGAPNDKYEQEADSMADKVVQRMSQSETQLSKGLKPLESSRSMIQTKEDNKLQKKEEEKQLEDVPELQKSPVSAVGEEEGLQMKCADCEKEEKGTVQRKENGETSASPSIESRLSASKGGGNPLPNETRGQMESVMGADFSGVRVHTGSEAVQMSRDLNAHAFTHGSDVYFNSGKYNPSNTEGSRLLAHELTHTVQQSGMVSKKIQRQALQCTTLLKSPSIMSNLSGTLVHQLITADFTSKVKEAVKVFIPGGSAAPLRTQGICGQDSPIIPSQIIGGNAGRGFPDLARNSTTILEVAEIKPADYMCVVDGEQQLLRYVTAGNASDFVAQQWRSSNGITTVIPMNPSSYTPPTLIYGNFQIQTAWCNPGLMVYKVTLLNQKPVPVPVLVPKTSPQEEGKWQRIKKFIQEIIDSGEEVEPAIRRFLSNNQDLINFVIAAGVLVIVATIAEDIVTAGVGIIDDFIMIPIATAMIRIAYSMQQFAR
jgi:Domain of unknown function (DUF4157)